MTDLEKMARAMEAHFHEINPGMRGREDDDWKAWISTARAALETIRTPSDTVINAIGKVGSAITREECVEEWQAAIDSILGEDRP